MPVYKRIPVKKIETALALAIQRNLKQKEEIERLDYILGKKIDNIKLFIEIKTLMDISDKLTSGQ